jgi:hypothetical protein
MPILSLSRGVGVVGCLVYNGVSWTLTNVDLKAGRRCNDGLKGERWL